MQSSSAFVNAGGACEDEHRMEGSGSAWRVFHADRSEVVRPPGRAPTAGCDRRCPGLRTLTPPSPRPATLTLEFTDVEVEGRPGRSVGVVDDSIVFVGDAGTGDDSGYRRDGRTLVVTGRGGALLPGLHDHHLHLMSLAARARSVPCGPPDTVDRAALARALRAAALRQGPGQWVRGYGYDDTVLGPLDAGRLDELLGEACRTPVRIQHRSGHQWVLNTAAVAALGLTGPDRSADGVYTDLDGRLRPHWPASDPPRSPPSGAGWPASASPG